MDAVDWSPLLNAVVILLAAVVASLQPALVKFLKAVAEEKLAKAKAADVARVYDVVSEAVAAANQIGGTNTEKKEMAVNYAAKRGGVDYETANVVIEAVIGKGKA